MPNWDVDARPRGLRRPPRRATSIAAPVQAAAELLAQAERPLILVGNGDHPVRRDARSCSPSPRSTGIPVITTLHGLGAFPQDHPLSARHAGDARLGARQPRHSAMRRAAQRRQRASTIASPARRRRSRRTRRSSTSTSTRARSASSCQVTVGIVGDARAALRALADAVPEPTGHNETLERWIARSARAARQVRAAAGVSPPPRLAVAPAARRLRARSTRRATSTARRASSPTSASTRCGRRSCSTGAGRART